MSRTTPENANRGPSPLRATPDRPHKCGGKHPYAWGEPRGAWANACVAALLQSQSYCQEITDAHAAGTRCLDQ
eukprot:4974813-Alexandrium_andersonii.AAC.1